MRKAVNLLVRREDMTHEEFVEYWLEDHAPLVDDVPHVTAYSTSLPADPERSAYDGIAEMYVESGVSVGDVFGSEAGQALQADTPNFLDDDASEFLVVDEEVQFSRED